MKAPSLDVVVARIGGTQTPLPTPLAVLVGLSALVVVVPSAAGSLIDRFNAVAHEGAHAIVGIGLGQKVLRVKLEANGDGLTQLSPGGGPGFVLAGVVGYLGPSGFGLGAAKLISLGYIVGALWAGIGLLLLLLPTLTRRTGGIFVLASAVALFLLTRYAPVGVQVVAAYWIAWALLLSGVLKVVDHGVGATDALILAGLLRVPRVLWVALWLSGTLLALCVGGDLLT